MDSVLYSDFHSNVLGDLKEMLGQQSTGLQFLCSSPAGVWREGL